MLPALLSLAGITSATTLQTLILQNDLSGINRYLTPEAELNQLDQYGSSGLGVACTFGRQRAMARLLEAGADPDRYDGNGSTALHTCAFFGRIEMVSMLLQSGADPFLRSARGSTPYDISASPPDVDEPLLQSLETSLRPFGFDLDRDMLARNRLVVRKHLEAFHPAAPDYTPVDKQQDKAWATLSAAESGIPVSALDNLYGHAARLPNLNSLLLIRNGRLFAEAYFNQGSIEKPQLLQSVTKSVTSALVGIALEQHCLQSIDTTVMTYFPEWRAPLQGSAKQKISLQMLLQMRSGFPWEETDASLWRNVLLGDYIPQFIQTPLTHPPGAQFQYSNFSSHWLGIAVQRSCDAALQDLARAYLFAPAGITPGEWQRDLHGYNFGHAELQMTARDMARFGMLYLNQGRIGDQQILPASWVRDSLHPWSEKVNTAGVQSGLLGRYFRHVGYGYQWWSALVGDHEVRYAMGHGGQMIILLPRMNMIIVTTAFPLRGDHSVRAWKHELSVINTVGRFIATLPAPWQSVLASSPAINPSISPSISPGSQY